MGKKYNVYYNGLFEKQIIVLGVTEKEAKKMCIEHNKTVPIHWFEIGIGGMHFIDAEKDKKSI